VVTDVLHFQASYLLQFEVANTKLTTELTAEGERRTAEGGLEKGNLDVGEVVGHSSDLQNSKLSGKNAKNDALSPSPPSHP
jgi:hypothetical protein